jgi:hypothetical protein
MHQIIRAPTMDQPELANMSVDVSLAEKHIIDTAAMKESILKNLNIRQKPDGERAGWLTPT